MNCTDGPAKIKRPPFRWSFYFESAVPTGSVRAPRHIYVPHVNEVYVTDGAHDQYADKQLANLQKRICSIEFLCLGLIIGCQGAKLGLPKIQTDRNGRFFLCFLILSQVRKLGSKNMPRFAHLRTIKLF